MWWTWIVVGCGRSVEAPSLPAPGHATEWDALVAAADRGDLETMKVLARDFSLGNVPDDDPSADKLGGALGFLQLAEDPEDVEPALEKAKEACVECHRARGIPGPPAR